VRLKRRCGGRETPFFADAKKGFLLGFAPWRKSLCMAGFLATFFFFVIMRFYSNANNIMTNIALKRCFDQIILRITRFMSNGESFVNFMSAVINDRRYA
jgi:hypothetical protein